MIQITRFAALLLCLFLCVPSSNAGNKKKKNNKSATQAEPEAIKAEEPEEPIGVKEYKAAIKESTSRYGLINVYKKNDSFLFEIPQSLLGKDLLLTSRVSTTSNNSAIVAGQMPQEPVLIKLSTRGNYLYIHKKVYKNICDPESSLFASFERNFTDPIWKSYKIKGVSPESSVLVDLSSLFEGDIKELSPFKKGSGGTGGLSGSPVSDLCMITSAKAFPMNLQVKSQMGYNTGGEPFTATMTRNIILLPETPMRPRHADPRIGYFDERKEYFTDKKDGVVSLSYIKRWNIQPKDSTAYARGETVEPAKPIVFYVDTAIPAKWRPYIKEGIEDWNKAFEKIGFKHVMIAKDYPANDPHFDPDDIRNNCYRMITTNVENSMGPSCSDPRSGEIIQADVLFYFNSVKILHSWQFIQTGAVDERARKEVFDSDMIGNSLRYVAAHEVGHTLGLLHNFRASSTIPVDSLRSASFTAQYGTTPSIMDYARYNYVAQPGDTSVNLRPPHLGVYDAYAIAWGYKPIYEATTPEDELPVLNRWIREKEKDRMYLYGPQYFFNSVDPSCQSEDLGDDVAKAGTYGIRNLQYILKNLPDWCVEEGKDYKRLQDAYNDIAGQLQRYLYHALMYVGGIYMDEPVGGDGKNNYHFISKKTQQEALQFVLANIAEMPKWMLDKRVVEKTGPIVSVPTLQARVLKSLFATSVSTTLSLFEQMEPENAYTYTEYMKEVYDFIWKKSLRNQLPDAYERQLQIVYVNSLLRTFSGAQMKIGGTQDLTSLNTVKDLFPQMCSCAHSAEADHDHRSISFFDYNPMEDLRMIKNPVIHQTADDLLRLLARLQTTTTDRTTKVHYQALYREVKSAMEGK